MWCRHVLLVLSFFVTFLKYKKTKGVYEEKSGLVIMYTRLTFLLDDICTLFQYR